MPFGFGRKSAEEQLAESGRRAQAEVLSSEPTKDFDSSYGSELNGRRWILGLRVQPPGEQPFEVEFKASLKVLCMPRAGDTTGVLYDPDDHARAVIDSAQDLAPRLHSHSDVSSRRTLPKGQEAIAEAETAAPDHRAELARFAQFYAQGALSDDEYNELRRRILGLPEPTVVATGFRTRGGNMLVFEQEADAGDPAAGAPAADPLDEIKRLAESRHSGALRNDEFEVRKRALLGDAD